MSTAQPALTTGLEKAAILVVLLGDEVGSKLYSHLPRVQWRQVTRKVAELGDIPPETAAGVLEEYYQLSAGRGHQIQGGKEYAEKVLSRAFGPSEAANLMENFVFAEDESAQDFSALQEAEPGRLADCLQAEHPQTIAIVLAQLGSRAARVLKHLGEETRVQVVQRLAGLRHAPPELVRKVSRVVSGRLGSTGPRSSESQASPGGARTVATLLNRLDREVSNEILAALAERDEELAAEIGDLMFTFEDFASVPAASLREVIGQVDKQTLALALSKASEAVQTHIFTCMSARAVQMMKEDMEVISAPPAEITAAQKEIIGIARSAEAEGRISLRSEDDEEEDA